MKFFYEVLVSVVLIVLVTLFLDPFMLWMPASMVQLMLVAVIVLFALFSVFVWRENAGDEREQFHKMMADRIGYLAGASLLVAGIVYQTFVDHAVDSWLISSLVLMVIAKLIALCYGRFKY